MLNLGILGYYKYADMFVGTLNELLNISLTMPEVELPLGISFYTFQAMSYSIDVYRKNSDIQKNPFKLLLYVSFFPQLVAGPIVKYKDVCDEIVQRKVISEEVAGGAVRFIIGLSKKIILSNTLGLVTDTVFSFDELSLGSLSAWIAAVSYMLQIYYDFSGYSDMAIGLGRMFGFHFKENFNYPYISLSIRDFWRRWHISLSTWFKEYLYIPLGGNRKGKFRSAINRITVFFFTGLWHGASWTFVVWGLYHGFFMLLETYAPKKFKLPKFAGHVYTLIVVCVGFVIFRADTFTQALSYIKNMFVININQADKVLVLNQLTPWFIFIFIIALIAVFPFDKVKNKVSSILSVNSQLYLKYAFSIILLVVCVLRISSGSYNPFIYFRF